MNSWILSMTWIFVGLVLWLLSFTPSERMALLAAFLVLLGVVGEEVAELKFLEGEKRSRVKERVKRWAVGILLLGLAGDVVGIVMGQAEMAELTRVAGDAKHSAQAAADVAKNANTEAAGAETKAEAADKEADEAQEKVKGVDVKAQDAASAAAGAEASADNLEKQLLRQGPRENLLMRCPFVNAVRPFAGQKIQIRANPAGISDPAEVEEMRGFVSSIRFLLGQVAGWSISEAQDENGWGIDVVVRRNSSPRTRDAAKALASAFSDCGLTDMQGHKPVSTMAEADTTFDRESGPPDTIVLYVGEHPH
jgi:hypothetical protein